jgi:microcin C transport system substrate-binding protein
MCVGRAAFALAIACCLPTAAAADAPVFPNEDAGADPAVPAEQGGKGFGAVAEKLGWTTNTTFPLIGAPDAKKGGELVRHVTDYPTNFRPIGPQANTYFNYLSRDLMYEGLLALHPNTEEFIPSLASHWKNVREGGVETFWYRINPNARWADGSPVTTEDVQRTWKLHVDPSLGEPSGVEVYGKFLPPVAHSKYILSVTCKKKNWRNFMYFSGMHVLPAKETRPYTGDIASWKEPFEDKAGDWAKDYNTKILMPSGPYHLDMAEQIKDQRLTLRRRKDYWNEGSRAMVGLYNFDRVSRVVINDEVIAYERLKKGEPGDINLLQVMTARRWVVEMNPKSVELIERGLLQKRKIFNEQPQGFQGIAINQRKAPYDDVRVRKALALLLDRKRLLKELMFNQYLPTRSYWPGGAYENPKNPRNDFDPRTALALLAEAGWGTRNSAGQLVNDKGEPLTMRLIYSSPGLEKHLTMYQESLQKAGITLTLELTRPEQLWQQVMERKYELASMAWGALLIPNPETSWKSTFADQLNNNNITGVKDPKIDALIEAYDAIEFEDLDKRRQLIQEIDGLLTEQYPYVLFWHGPYERFLAWDLFGHPACGLTRTNDDRDVEVLWWYDSDKAAALEKARKDGGRLPIGPGVIKHWRELREGKTAEPGEGEME